MLSKPARPVRIASISGPRGYPDAFLREAEVAAAQRPDLIVLPETWQDAPPETLNSEVIAHLQALARGHRCYIVHPTYLLEDGKRTNTALLIGRGGEIAGRYDKRYPYWPELDTDESGRTCTPGRGEGIIACDFGKIAIRICFDANFPGVWADAAEGGAELVIWPSAYGAGAQLMAHALNHHYPIVTSTLSGHCMVFDIDGERVLNVRGEGHFTQWITLDLDRCIFHENFNEAKLDALLRERPRRVEVEKRKRAEQWIVVRAAREDVSAREVCARAGMEELRAYKERSRSAIDALRAGIALD
ncbi:MAG: carbon-nitrogen hydrolase family protein [Clostridia bacterium]|nr:carbon-nitrogen hydrolase family protein [Clostridia bacterium]